MSDFINNKCIPLQTIGGGGGGSFSSCMEDGSLISRIEAWADDNRMRGIKVYYSKSQNGYSAGDQGFMFGQAGGTKYEYTFAPGERIVNLSIWNTKWDGNTFVGAFKFKTSLGNTFYPKEKTSSHKEYVLNVGYGALVGIAGRSGNALDSLGFYIIRPAKKVKLSDVYYDESSMPTPIANNIVDMPYTNNSDVEQTYEYQYSYTAYREKSWTVSSGFEQSYSLTISAEVPVLEASVGAEASASWTYTQETSNTSTYSYSQQVTTTYPVVVPAHTQMNLDMTYFSGNCDVSYYGTVALTLDNNQMFSYMATGTYSGGNTTQVTTTLTSTPLSSNGQPAGESTVTVDMVPVDEKMAA